MTKKTKLGILALVAAGVALLLHDSYTYLMIVAHLTLIPAVLYPVVYSRSPWRKGPTGRALMNKAVAVALLYTIGLLGIWWPFPGYSHLYALVVTYLGVAISYQFGVMLKLKARAKRNNVETGQP